MIELETSETGKRKDYEEEHNENDVPHDELVGVSTPPLKASPQQLTSRPLASHVHVPVHKSVNTRDCSVSRRALKEKELNRIVYSRHSRNDGEVTSDTLKDYLSKDITIQQPVKQSK